MPLVPSSGGFGLGGGGLGGGGRGRGGVIVPIDADVTGLQRGLRQADGAIAGFGGRMDAFGQRLDRTGRTLTRRLTLPLVAAGAAAGKLAFDFEKSMKKINTLVGVSQDQVDKWSKQILELGPKVAKSPRELADAMFFITSAGLRGSDALDVLEASAKAAAAGLGETKDVADAVTSAMNAYGSETLSASEATDILLTAVREGKAEPAEFATNIGKVLPVAAEMGVEFHEVAAAVAAMTRTGTQVPQATTQVRQALMGLLKPTKQTEDTMRDLGTSADEVRKSLREKGLLATLEDLRKRTGGNEEAMARLFPNVRALAGVLDLTGKNLEDNRKIFESHTEAVGATDEAFAKGADTAERKFAVALARLQAAAIRLGQRILPVVAGVAEGFGRVIDAIDKLPSAGKKILAFAAVGLAALGPLMRLVGGVSRGIGGAATMFGRLGPPTAAGGLAAGGAAGLGRGVVPVLVTNPGFGAGGAGAGAPGAAGTAAAGAGARMFRPGLGGIAARGGMGIGAGALVGALANQIAGSLGLSSGTASVTGGLAGGATAGAMIGGTAGPFGALIGAIAGASTGGLIQGFRSFLKSKTSAEVADQFGRDLAQRIGQGGEEGFARLSTAALRAQQKLTEIRLGFATGDLAAAEAEVVKAQEKLGEAAGKALVKSLNTAVDFRTAVSPMVAEITAGLEGLKPEAQKAGLHAVMAWVDSMVSRGRMTRDAADNLVKQLVREFEVLEDELPLTAAGAMDAVRAELEGGKALGAFKGFTDEVTGMFDNMPHVGEITAENITTVYKRTMDALRERAKTGTKEQRQAAREMARALQAEYEKAIKKLKELEKAQAEAATGAGVLGGGIETAMRAMSDAVRTHTDRAIADFRRLRDTARGPLGSIPIVGGAARGALIPGAPGSPVPIVAHAGEVVLNPSQQRIVGIERIIGALRATGGRIGGDGAFFQRGGYVYPLPSRGRIIGTPYAGTHTLGNWQSDLAYDLAAPAGTQVLSPIVGSVTRITGSASQGGRFGGLGVYVSGGGGQFFLKHLGSSIRAGSSVQAGTPVGTIGDYYGSANHVHFAASTRAALEASVKGPIGGAVGRGAVHVGIREPAAPRQPSAEEQVAKILGSAANIAQRTSAQIDRPVSGRRVAQAGRRAAAAGRREGVSAEEIAARSEEAERAAERRELLSDRAKVDKALRATRKQRNELRKKRGRPGVLRRARAQINAQIRELLDMRAVISARLAELGEAEARADYEAAREGDFTLPEPTAAERITTSFREGERAEIRAARVGAEDAAIAAGASAAEVSYAGQRAEIETRRSLILREMAAVQGEYDRQTQRFNSMRAERNRLARQVRRAGPKRVAAMRRRIRQLNAAMQDAWNDILGLHELAAQLRRDAADVDLDLADLDRARSLEQAQIGEADDLTARQLAQAEERATKAERELAGMEAFLQAGFAGAVGPPGTTARAGGVTIIVQGHLATEREILEGMVAGMAAQGNQRSTVTAVG